MSAMRVAALYDVHGNLPALDAVLADPRFATADRIVVGGDVVAGPMPAECLERLRAFGERVLFVRGNGDRETVSRPTDPGLEPVRRFCRSRLTREQLAFVRGWSLTVQLDVDGLGGVEFCHGTPSSDTEIVTRITPDEELRLAMESAGAATVVCGHTHVQFERTVGGLRVVNAGSVGAPYAATPHPRWALLGPDVELCTTPYGAEEALPQLIETGFPGLDAWMGAIVCGEVSADEATAEFEARRIASRSA